MPIESYVKTEHDLIIFKHIGRVEDDEFLSFYRSFFESDKFKPPMDVLVDLRETSSITRSPEALLRFAEFAESKLANIAPATKIAVVASKDRSFGLARMYEILSDSVKWDFVVFRSMDAALAWLGLPDETEIEK
jgi:hypothetical protein